jgi:cytochrome c-type biogenesis protein CcmH/NrfG
MLAALARAEAIDAAYAEAGPARVQALVLTRAPGWPLGPGDAARAVEAAQRAVALRPAYPPNWLALAEAQSKAGSAADAQASYARARNAARALPESFDRAHWLGEAEQHLGPSS